MAPLAVRAMEGPAFPRVGPASAGVWQGPRPPVVVSSGGTSDA